MPDEPSTLNPAYLSDQPFPGLEDLIIAFCEAHPRLRKIVRRLVELADHEDFRTRMRAMLRDRKRHGVWAPIRVNGGKPIKRNERVIVPFCEFEMTLKAWSLILRDLASRKNRHKTLNCRTPIALVKAFRRKIENTLKTLAKQQDRHDAFDPEELASHIRADNIVYIGMAGQTSLDPHQIDDDIDAKTFFERAKRHVNRRMPQWQRSFERYVNDEGYGDVQGEQELKRAYRETEDLLKYLRDHIDAINSET